MLKRPIVSNAPNVSAHLHRLYLLQNDIIWTPILTINFWFHLGMFPPFVVSHLGGDFRRCRLYSLFPKIFCIVLGERAHRPACSTWVSEGEPTQNHIPKVMVSLGGMGRGLGHHLFFGKKALKYIYIYSFLIR